MFTVRRRGAARIAAAVLATGLFTAGAISGAGTAVADGTTPTAGGATAVLGGLQEDKSDLAVITEDGKEKRVSAGLFEMAVDKGGSIQTYCIDIHQPTTSAAPYQEVDWKSSSLGSNADAGKINWVLQHSYPQVSDLYALAKSAGIEGTLTQKLAAAGTQVAIWRLSDKVEVTAENEDAEKLADYLQEYAADSSEPDASLTLDPTAVSGKSGEKLGPITVSTNASTVEIAASLSAAAGIRIVDKDGKVVTTAANGTQLFFDVPDSAADGSTSLTATATTKVPVGRVFISGEGNERSQTQILAGSSDSTVTATATGAWAAKGPIPAVSAEVDCSAGGVDVTASNEGDQRFTFTLAGNEHTVEAGKSDTITVPVEEDNAYKITIAGPDGFEKTFEGVLDCKTTSSAGGTTGVTTGVTGGTTDEPSNEPSPASAGGATTTTGAVTGGGLAETGSSSATPLIAGIAVALVVIGGGAVFFLRKRKATSTGE